MTPARKYLPLNRYLEQVPPDEAQVSLSFQEIEDLLEASLPPSAWLPHYWSGSSVARYNWERSGFCAKLDRLQRRVTFTRGRRRPY
jgi:hypothetical protein